MTLTRRAFTSGLIAATAATAYPLRAATPKSPLASLPSTKSTFKGVTIGANSGSLGQLALSDAIRAFATIGFGMAELHPRHIEPSFGATGFRRRGGPPPTPEQIEAAKAAREKLRNWRLTVPLETFESAGKDFKAAGLFLYSYNMNFDDEFTDEEIDRSFLMTRALGCNVMTAVGSKQLLRRLGPFAENHKLWVAIHNEPATIPTLADFDEVLSGMGPYMKMCLDTGHFVASNSDPVSALDSHHDKVIDLHIKDRRKDNGPNLPFGQGDTPIARILSMDRDRKYHMPAQIEWEVPADTNEKRIDAVRQCFEYCKTELLKA